MNTSSSNIDPTAATAAMAGFGLVGGLFLLAIFIFSIVLYWRVAVKAGYNGAMSLLLLIPLVNIVVIVMFAFSKWPIERELDNYRGGGGGFGGGGFGGGGMAGGAGAMQTPWPPPTPPTPPSAGPYLPPGA